MIFKELEIQEIKEAKGISKFIGLMFKKNPKPIFFKMSKLSNFPIHSYFVRVTFLAIWLDEDDDIIDIKLVKPKTNNIKPSKSFKTLIELPLYKNA